MSAKSHPVRLRRSESFLGIHFDFHAGADCTQVGKNVTPEMVEAIIDEVGPDYLQCDCKGHAGYASYPTKVGTPAPGFVTDPLRIWRDVTARRGVALYLHYSGVYDARAVALHPEWACLDPDGKPDAQYTSVFGGYADGLLIPQIKELIDEYDVDGIWIDGDAWAVKPDYRPDIVERFRAQTGIQMPPRGKDDPGFYEFMEIAREGFRQYLRHYVDELHKHRPSFQIASNWSFSSFMPEAVSAKVDFLSGDYSPEDSFNSARYEGRCMAGQGMPWDLMAWSFGGKMEDASWSTKTVPQLQQEAAAVLALGGGFQAYFQQNRDASVNLWQMKLMGETAKFCRARQKFCHRATAVPQIAIVNSAAAFYRTTPLPFTNGWTAGIRGLLTALLEDQHCVEILPEHRLAGRMAEYPLIVVPEWAYLEPAFVEELLAYARGGGKLLIVGPSAAALFGAAVGVELVGKVEEKRRWLEHDGWMGFLKTLCQEARCLGDTEPFGRLYARNNPDGPGELAGSIATCGKGQIAAVYFCLGSRYYDAPTPTSRKFLTALVRRLFPDPIVEVKGSHYVDVTVNRIDGKLAVNLINTAGGHNVRKTTVFDEIPPVGPLEIAIRLPRRPAKITLQPQGRDLPFGYAAGQARLVLEKLDIHSVLIVE